MKRGKNEERQKSPKASFFAHSEKKIQKTEKPP
jgi:hypothetical protein